MIAITVRLEDEVEKAFSRLKKHFHLKNTDVLRQAILEYDRQLTVEIEGYLPEEEVGVISS